MTARTDNVSQIRIGFDIGGTHMRVARIEGEKIGVVQKIDTPSSPDAAQSALTELIERSASGESVESIVGAVAGVISPEGVIVSSPNLPKWNGFALAEALRSRFITRVEVGNDAEFEGLGEALFGAGRGYSIVAYLTLGTGVGGARIVAGAIDRRAVGYEPGHQIIDVIHGATLESLIGGASLARIHEKEPKELPQAIWEELAPVLGAGIWNAIVHWSPDIVVLAGSLMNEKAGFKLADVTREVGKYRRIIPEVPPIRLAELGDTAGLYGALAIARK